MNNKSFMNVAINLLMTKEGKALLKEGIAAFFTQWAGNSIAKKIIAKIILLIIAPFVTVRKQDISLETLLNNRIWWDQVGDSISHTMVSHDMAVVKHYAEALSTHAPDVLGKVCSDIWMYPAKVVTLLSCVPAIVNAVIRSINASLEPINQQSPDLLADVINALIGEVDTKALGCTANQCIELLRKFDTGDELIKESSSSPFEHFVKDMVRELLNGIDVNTKQKFVSVLLSIKNKIHNGVFEALNEKPEDLSVVIHFLIRSRLQQIANARKYITHKTQIRLDELPVEEIAYFVNDLLKRITTLHETDATLFNSAINRFAHSIDNEVLEYFLTHGAGDCFNALTPTLQRVFPFVLGCWTKLIENEDEELQQARVNFARALLKDVEVGNV